MFNNSRLIGTFVATALLLLAISGCAQSDRDQELAAGSPQAQPSSPAPATVEPAESEPAAATVDEPEQATLAAAQQEAAEEADPQAQVKAKREAEEKAEKEAEEKAKKEAKEACKRERKLPKLERDLDVAKMKLEKAEHGARNDEIQFGESVEKAEAELNIARRKLGNLVEITAPHRIARAELTLQRAEDGFKDAQQELAQLELMYSDEQFADQTKEIVIERAKRRLARSQRDLELRHKETETLREVTIPLEITEHELRLVGKERALTQLKRGRGITVIDKRIAVIGAEAEIIRLDNALSDLREEIEEAAQKKAEEDKKAAGKEAAEADKP